MRFWRVMWAEIRFRKTSFALGCLSVAVALAAITGSRAMLRAHDLRTEQLVEAKERETREAMARMENDYRVIMKRMGYNAMILAGNEDLAELRVRGYTTEMMPFEHAEKLAESGVLSLNHLLPVLHWFAEWPENGEEVLFSGVRGQMAIPARGGPARSPIQAPIPPGSVALGNALAARIDVTAGEQVTIKGEKFRVERVDPPRGNIDDMTVWLALDKVQAWRGVPGMISGILALECVCHSDNLGEIVREVSELLPDVRIFEFSSTVRGRAEARARASVTARDTIAAEQAQRSRLREERARLATTISALAVGGAVLWILLLSYGNARDRRGEIGMLRAVGLRQSQIMGLLLSKALLMGVCGGIIGIAAGIAIGARTAEQALEPQGRIAGEWLYLVGMAALGPILAGLAALAPSLTAARRDPAEILGKE